MKKYLFMAAVAGLTLTSCSQEELSVPVAENNEITFALPVVGKNTRAVTETGKNYNDQPFAVWAKYTETPASKWSEGVFYINGDNGVEASYTGRVNGWAFANPYYWPKNGYLSFIAYSPVAAKATVTNDGIQFTNYVVGTDADVDLLFSEVARNKQSSADEVTTNPYEGVNIAFKHALSSVRFAVKTKDVYTGTTIKVQKIEVLKACSKGTFNQGLELAAGNVTDSAEPCWSGQTAKTDYTAFDGDITVEPGAKYVHNDASNATTDMTDLILLPQSLSGVQVQLTYTIKSADSAALPQTTTLDLGGEWFRGTRYTYTIVFGLNEIYLDPTVEDWKDVSSSPEI